MHKPTPAKQEQIRTSNRRIIKAKSKPVISSNTMKNNKIPSKLITSSIAISILIKEAAD